MRIVVVCHVDEELIHWWPVAAPKGGQSACDCCTMPPVVPLGRVPGLSEALAHVGPVRASIVTGVCVLGVHFVSARGAGEAAAAGRVG